MRRFATYAAKGWFASSAIHVGALGAAVAWQAGLFEPANISPRGGRMSIDSIAALAGTQATLELTESPAEATFLAPPSQASLDQEPPAESLVDPLADSATDAAPLDTLAIPLDQREGSTFVPPNLLAALPRSQTPPSDNFAAPQAPATPPAETAAQSPGNATVNSINSLADQGNDVPRLPQFSRNLPIAYPQEAFAARWEGTPRLRLKIAADGRVTNVEVVGSSGYSVLDEAAARGVSTWRAEPAKLAGTPVASTHVMRVIFKL